MTVDKILTLKTVSLFTETPDEMLAEVVELLDEIEVKAGDSIIKKGDPGTCLYIIAHGRVRVHDEERTLNFLGKRDVFGEMAALDPEPRVASVTAAEDTLLYRLDQEPLYTLMAKRPEVARGIIRILSRHLRARVRDMAEDYKYMQQFNRVTAAAVAVEAGVYEPESLDEVAQRTDQLGQLARVFQRTIREVYIREQRLKQQVAELRIEIDEANQARKVAEITETDYFQELQKKARDLRAALNDKAG
jgi:signal-transduction protein with cAMP-binding, CBS, and nucleotidyltransferase domain